MDSIVSVVVLRIIVLVLIRKMVRVVVWVIFLFM